MAARHRGGPRLSCWPPVRGRRPGGFAPALGGIEHRLEELGAEWPDRSANATERIRPPRRVVGRDDLVGRLLEHDLRSRVREDHRCAHRDVGHAGLDAQRPTPSPSLLASRLGLVRQRIQPRLRRAWNSHVLPRTRYCPSQSRALSARTPAGPTSRPSRRAASRMGRRGAEDERVDVIENGPRSDSSSSDADRIRFGDIIRASRAAPTPTRARPRWPGCRGPQPWPPREQDQLGGEHAAGQHAQREEQRPSAPVGAASVAGRITRIGDSAPR